MSLIFVFLHVWWLILSRVSIRRRMTPLLLCVLALLIHSRENKGFDVQDIFDANSVTKQLNVEKVTENSSNIHEEDWFDHLWGKKEPDLMPAYHFRVFWVFVNLWWQLLSQSHGRH